MVLDYKDVSFSFRTQKKRVLLKKIKITAVALLVLLLFYLTNLFLESRRINEIQALLSQNNLYQAETKLEKSEYSFLKRNAKIELRAIIQLFRQDTTDAAETLEKISNRDSSIRHKQFLDFFLDNARYGQLKLYADYLQSHGEDTLFYKAIYESALFNHAGSTEVLNKLPENQLQANNKVVRILNKLNDTLETGKINYIFDVNGKPLAYYNIQKQETFSLTPGIHFNDFTQDLGGSVKYYKLSLYLDIQKKVDRLFKNYHGSFLLLNLTDNSIAAAYSKPLKRSKINTVFTETFEPASIIKVITLFAYFNKNKKGLFPLNCKGNLKIDNRIFYDSRTHAEVSSPAEALAVSCNVAFAKIGIDIGYPEISKTLELFFFNSSSFKDRFLEFNTGTFSKNVETGYQLAKLSVGLSSNNENVKRKENLISATTLQSALISAMIAQNGSIYPPYLIKNIKNHLDQGYYNHTPEIIKKVSNNLAFTMIKEAMTAVVQSKKGTGRRSKVDFVKTALKTGTAGDRKKGYDAILTGFFPADRPRYAFALRLERAGKAEFNGAYFLKDFLKAFYEK